jgi:hypothetical protein
MKDEMGSKEQYIRELMDLRKRVAELEALEAGHQREKMALRERAERYRQVVKKANEAPIKRPLSRGKNAPPARDFNFALGYL